MGWRRRGVTTAGERGRELKGAGKRQRLGSVTERHERGCAASLFACGSRCLAAQARNAWRPARDASHARCA
ncbi:hypothetical protein GLE_2197 [Lysobacter enzymogenes]|uniref:Uncharacterized protein n=1 Tax=Lysobacter enzymogenes TaxID=69 RepID=A0A0S2DG96_LYSEN|nr:hypothetical protein GLE_2197 [Lysobacter enzymogenes]